MQGTTQGRFTPSLHLFSDRNKKGQEFCDIRYIQDFHRKQYLTVSDNFQKFDNQVQLVDFIVSAKEEINKKYIQFNEPLNNKRCPEIILETAWELTKRNIGRILILDCDMRTNSLNKNFHLKKTQSLADYVKGGLANIELLIKKTNIHNVFLVQGGRLPKEKINMMLSEKFSELLDYFNRNFDFIMVNTPPYLGYVDAFLLAKVLRPIFIQVVSNDCTHQQLAGIKAELNVLNLPFASIEELN